MDIESALNQLVVALRNSPEYRKLASAKSVVNSNAKLKSLIDDLETKQSRLYRGNLSESEAGSLYAEINSDIQRLSGISEAKDYFDAHESFDALMNKVMSGMAQSLRV